MKKHWHLHIERLLYQDSSSVLLKDTDIELNPDYIYGVMGNSGSGKTSLWEALIHYPKPSLQADYSITMNKQLWKNEGKIALVPQQPAYTLNPVISIQKSLMDVLQVHGKDSRYILDEILLKASLDKTHIKKYPHELSGGELQRVAFALSLCMNSEWLILDEPTASLDKLTAGALLESAKKWQNEAEGLLIISSHDGHILSKYCDRIIFLEDRKLQGPFEKRDVKDRLLMDFPDDQPSRQSSESNYLISMSELHFSYEERHSTFRLEASLDIPAQSILGLTGRSGSGKSTLGRIVAGYFEKERPKIHYGEAMDSEHDIQYIPQDAILNFHPYQTMEDQLWPIYKRWYPGGDLSDMKEFLQAIQIKEQWLRHSIYELSGGQRQRFLLARALFPNPKLLILDETFSALDHYSVREYIQWLLSIYEELETSFFIISHDIGLLQSICQKIYVMSDGRLIDEILPGENANNNSSAVTKALLQSYH